MRGVYPIFNLFHGRTVLFMSVCVLLVDDNAAIRRSIRVLFESDSGFEVAGEAVHGAEAIEKAIELNPHLIVLDFSMPIMNGIEAAPILLKHCPNVCLIMLTLFTGEDVEISAREAGIHAFVPKHKAATHLIPAAQALFVCAPPRVEDSSVA